MSVHFNYGEYSDKGVKQINQDYCGHCIPDVGQLATKGAAFAVADGISTSPVSHIASETLVKSFLADYYCTSDAWTVEHAVNRVLNAANSWLYAEGRHSAYRYEKEKGYVTTFSAVILKAQTAHIFHIGDSRIYRLREGALEQLTNDHRYWISSQENYLSRAFGIDAVLDLDYHHYTVRDGDIFLLMTDGVYEHLPAETLIHLIENCQQDYTQAANDMVRQAIELGSRDNLTVEIIRVNEPEVGSGTSLQKQLDALELPPSIEPGMTFDGFQIISTLQLSSRSHIFLALDQISQTQVVLKAPSVDQREDPLYLERLLMEEWIARRIHSRHVVTTVELGRPRRYLYTITEYVEGMTLAQWLMENPAPQLDVIRGIVEQIVKGLYAFHRKDMLHQDIRPENIMIDITGTIKIIDFGSTRVAGVEESGLANIQPSLLGTALYAAPEYFLGESGSTRSDLYSLAALTYYMISGAFPYGTQVAKTRTIADQKKLCYRSVLNDERAIPSWVDAALKKALHPDPDRRYAEMSEFLADLKSPNAKFMEQSRRPLIERDPVQFWKGVSSILFVTVLFLLAWQYFGP